MKDIFRYWGEIKKELQNKNLFLFLDYDGTLTPITYNPSHAVLLPGVKRILLQCKRSLNGRCAVISGRSLASIKKMVGIRGIIYAGNHGLEIEMERKRYTPVISGEYSAMLKKVAQNLRQQLCKIPGVWVEDKGLNIALHYRMAAAKKNVLIRKMFNQIVEPYMREGHLRSARGKKVLEILPPVNWNKGEAVRWILTHYPVTQRDITIMPLFIGDDTTDEDVFRMFKHNAITIVVGARKKSAAQYCLKNTREVYEFLKMFCMTYNGEIDA